MKKICKVILAAAAIAALAVPAMGADTDPKLQVKNAAGITRNTVTGEGYMGIGTTAPKNPVHILTSNQLINGTDPNYNPAFFVEGVTNGERLEIRSNTAPVFQGKAFDGTNPAAPLPLPDGKILFALGAGGYSGDPAWNLGGFTNNLANIIMWTEGAWTYVPGTGTTSSGTAITFSTVAPNTPDAMWANEAMRITGAGRVGIGTPTPTSMLQVVGLLPFTSNAAAIAAGLTPGAFYRTSTGTVMVVY